MRSKRKRLLAGVLAPLGLLLVLLGLLCGGRAFCPVYELTGLFCPGCGTGRAVLALLHGHPAEAFGHNALLFLLGLPCGVLLCREYLRYVFPRLGLRRVTLPKWSAFAALAVLIAFTVLRNLPGFEYLAP